MICIEIRKAGFINKGAQLMLLAILNQLRNRYDDLIIVSETTGEAGEFPYKEVVKLGMLPKGSLQVKNQNLDFLFRILHPRILQKFGIILNKQIDVVIDAAGFAYSSQWGEAPVKNLLQKVLIAAKHKSLYILLPQSFGPFESSRIKANFQKALRHIALVFPRDEFSRSSIEELAPPNKFSLKVYPDFTNLIDGVVPKFFDSSLHNICFVPNQRMLDKLSPLSNESYIDLFVHAIGHLHKTGHKPFLLVHETQDNPLVNTIAAQLDFKIPIICEDDPLKIKGIIGSCKLLIGSRYHSLVSAFSQNVPAIGTGWSHKYQALFEDYDALDYLIGMDQSKQEFIDIVDDCLSPSKHKLLREKLMIKSREYKNLSLEMWDVVFTCIDSHLYGLQRST